MDRTWAGDEELVTGDEDSFTRLHNLTCMPGREERLAARLAVDRSASNSLLTSLLPRELLVQVLAKLTPVELLRIVWLMLPPVW